MWIFQINSDSLGRHTKSWHNPKIRMTRNPLADSSSEYNLSRYINGKE